MRLARVIRFRAAVFLVCYAAAVVYLSLYPLQFTRRPEPLYWMRLVPPYAQRLILDGLLNLGLYVPLGAAMMAVIGRTRLRALTAILLGFAISFAVEWTQRYVPTRMGTYNDLLANTCGTALGVGIVWLWWTRPNSLLRNLLKSCLSPPGAVLAGLWILWHVFLLLPVLKHTRFAAFEAGSTAFWTDSINVFLGFLALSLALRFHPRTTIVLAVLPPAVVLFAHPQALFVRLAASALAIPISRIPARFLKYFLPSALLIWLVFSELRPFKWGAPQHFTWFPFDPLFSNPVDQYYPVVFGKLFLYTAIVWSIRHTGARWVWASGIPALILAALEFAQRYLPGRTPEITDVLLMAGGAILLWLADPQEQRQPSDRAITATPGLRA